MYYAAEINITNCKTYNKSQKEAARARLNKNRQHERLVLKREECTPNRKAKARLDLRQKDWERMRADNKHDMKVQTRIDGGGFHRPGSLK